MPQDRNRPQTSIFTLCERTKLAGVIESTHQLRKPRSTTRVTAVAPRMLAAANVVTRQDLQPYVKPTHFQLVPCMHRTSHRFPNRCILNWFCLRLCQNRPGRIIIHVAVLLRSRKNIRWHLTGIRRDLLPRNGNLAPRRIRSDWSDAD